MVMSLKLRCWPRFTAPASRLCTLASALPRPPRHAGPCPAAALHRKCAARPRPSASTSKHKCKRCWPALAMSLTLDTGVCLP